MDTVEEIAALATRFIDAVEGGDVETAIACYAPDARIWHNTDGEAQSPAENAAVLEGFVKGVPTRSYDERRLNVFPGGFVERHVLRGATRRGVSFELAACIVCEVKGGKITRLDEYFDSAAVAALTRSA
jgi:ketosteroid isomerase-like protein